MTLSLLVRMEHPAYAKFIVECSVDPKEVLAQRIPDLASLGEFFKQAFQLWNVPPARQRQAVLPRTGVLSGRNQSDSEISTLLF